MISIHSGRLVLVAAGVFLTVFVLSKLIFGWSASFAFVICLSVLLAVLAIIFVRRRELTSGLSRFWAYPLIVVAWAACVSIGLWNQPYLGANVCPRQGLMWEADFLEVLRPKIHGILAQSAAREGTQSQLAERLATVDSGIDVFKQCLSLRGREYCRYAGPHPGGNVTQGRTVSGPNSISLKDEYKYRLVVPEAPVGLAILPFDVGGARFVFMPKDKSYESHIGLSMCELGCFCN